MTAMPLVEGLEDYWASQMGHAPRREAMADQVLLDTLGLGNQQVLEKLHSERPDFEAFRDWIVATAGPPDPILIARYHAWLTGEPMGEEAEAQLAAIAALPAVLDEAALAHWDEHGYAILSAAISPEEIAAVKALLWRVIDASPDNPDSWAGAKTNGIMIPYFQHPALEAARRSPRVHKAFAQLWGTENLWVTIDRMGFNPPLACGGFKGSGLHWDVSLVRPIPFSTGGILYLTDTEEDHGAFRCVPGFHHRIDAWLDEIGDADPRAVDLSGQVKYVAGLAGDLIIWRQDLPHAASPNHGSQPRLAQYLNYYSPDMIVQPEWR